MAQGYGKLGNQETKLDQKHKEPMRTKCWSAHREDKVKQSGKRGREHGG